jgi:hypothetical protein
VDRKIKKSAPIGGIAALPKVAPKDGSKKGEWQVLQSYIKVIQILSVFATELISD